MKKVYDQTNSRGRDLLSLIRASGASTDLSQDIAEPVEEYSYTEKLKTSDYNTVLKELFTDYAEDLKDAKDFRVALYLLQRFYVDIQKITREEKKFKKQERKKND